MRLVEHDPPARWRRSGRSHADLEGLDRLNLSAGRTVRPAIHDNGESARRAVPPNRPL